MRINVAGHSVEDSILGDGVVIDIGCRGFEFADNFKDSKLVYCLDPDPDVFKNRESHPNISMLNLAVTDYVGTASYYKNGESTCLKDYDGVHPHLFDHCKTITMETLYGWTGKNVDILKLDCEGSEYVILGDGFEPVPKQISVEFHHHTVPEIHDSKIDHVMEILSKYYHIAYQHESGMDNLFIRKW